MWPLIFALFFAAGIVVNLLSENAWNKWRLGEWDESSDNRLAVLAVVCAVGMAVSAVMWGIGQ